MVVLVVVGAVVRVDVGVDVEVEVDVVVVVDVEVAHDAKTRDVTMRQVTAIQIALLSILASFCVYKR